MYFYFELKLIKFYLVNKIKLIHKFNLYILL